jgi:hypothetical protein
MCCGSTEMQPLFPQASLPSCAVLDDIGGLPLGATAGASRRLRFLASSRSNIKDEYRVALFHARVHGAKQVETRHAAATLRSAEVAAIVTVQIHSVNNSPLKRPE